MLTLYNNIITISSDGINIYNYKNNNFKTYFQKNDNTSTRDFFKDSKGDLYVFTYSGFFKKNADENNFKPFIFSSLNDKRQPKDFLYGYYPINDTLALGYGFAKKLFTINFKSKTFEPISYPETLNWRPYTEHSDIESIDQDRYYLAGTNGLFEYNIKTNTFIDRNQLSETVNLKNHKINDVYFNKNENTLWLGTQSLGLFFKNLNTGEVCNFAEDNANFPICSNNVIYIMQDKNDMVWVGTAKGLQKINPITLASENMSKNKGFKNQHIVGILEDEYNNNLWLSTYNGLICYNTVTEEVSDFFESDGISNNEFNAKSFYKANDTTFYFGGISGVTMFNPNQLLISNNKPKISLTKVSRFDKEHNKKKAFIYGLSDLSQFRLPYNQNYITLFFAINDVPNLEKCTYEYKIEEIKNEWISIGNFNQIQLQGLRADDYNISVRGYNSKGKLTNTLTYKVKVDEVFYKTNWFIILVIALLISLSLLWAYFLRKRIIANYETQNKLKQLEARSLRALMNPHFIFNALNGIQSIMITKGEKAVNKYISTFSKLMRFTLDTNDFEYVHLEKEITYLNTYLEIEKYRLNDNLNYEIITEGYLDIKHIKIPNMILQPIVENAIVHGLTPKKTNRTITIKFKKLSEDFIIEVEDNGVGRKAAEENKSKIKNQYQSWSSSITKDRIAISNKVNTYKISMDIDDLYHENQPSGTKVVLRFQNLL
ncbi:histidine kinase [uncultured Winogradskyella sp.]|uniref:sensor histidine kinase n=1 Tax=uncultured Winogradskyella sp. TaxID=395353 RepID=UPI002621D1BD|nr:histidine kinase [uncultured Winogradskyella sp.]